MWPVRPVIGGACARSSAIRRPSAAMPVNRSPRVRQRKRDVTSPTRSATGSSRGTADSWLSVALAMQGDLAQACRGRPRLGRRGGGGRGSHHDGLRSCVSCRSAFHAGAAAAAAHAAAQSAQATAATIGGFFEDTVYALFANAALAGGDAPAARQAAEEALRHTVPAREVFIRGASPGGRGRTGVW